ncbi:MAG: helix-turn-helix domain-containing protein [Cyanobacteria bacterium J06635_10]
MADIAKKVGISRPALYLHFENKESIFRALLAELHEGTLEQAQTALNENGKIGDRLLKAFEYRTVELFAVVCNSVHGEELIDINGKVAADVFLAAKHKFVGMLTQALQEAQACGEIQLEYMDARAAAWFETSC